MTDNEIGAAEATIYDHARNAIHLMKRGAHMNLRDIPNDPSFLSSHFGPEVTAELGKLLEAALAAQAQSGETSRPIEYRHEEGGFVEFINHDRPCIVRDIPSPAAILLDMETRQVIGYRVYDTDRAAQSGERTTASVAFVCDICGRNSRPDTIVSNEEWARISPTGDENGNLCAACMVSRLGYIAAMIVDAHAQSGETEGGTPPPQTQLEGDDHATAARYQRLHRTCSRILWTDLGVPAMENPQTQAAMAELAEIMFMDALIAATAATTEGSEP